MRDYLKILIALIGFFILAIFFEVTMSGFASLMGWSSGGSSISTFTGLSPIIKISPLIMWLAVFGASIYLIISGIKGLWPGSSKKGGGGDGGGGMH